jgi:hypothetical protein
LESVLNVTVVRDDLTETSSETSAVDLSGWVVEMETASLPAALWDASKPKENGPQEPSADLVPDCITGIRRLKPPAGQRGARVSLTDMTWNQLDASTVPRAGSAQDVPTGTRARDIQKAANTKQARHKSVAVALAAAGFDLAWTPPQVQVCFRELQAEPLAGEVAPSVR